MHQLYLCCFCNDVVVNCYMCNIANLSDSSIQHVHQLHTYSFWNNVVTNATCINSVTATVLSNCTFC